MNITTGTYPFSQLSSDSRLTRADVEYLLASHEDGRGPVIWSEEQSRPEKMRDSIDFRGTILDGLDLSKLPLTRAIFGLRWNERLEATEEQQIMAAASLVGTNLWGANLEGIRGHRIDLRAACLAHTYMEKAQLRYANLAGTDLHGSQLKEVDLEDAILCDPKGITPRLADITWGGTKLSNLDWSNMRQLGDDSYARKLTHQGGVSKKETMKAYREAMRASLQVSVMLEQQGLGDEAVRLRYRSKVLHRRLLWLQHAWKQWLGSLLLALIAGYGYRLWRIFMVYGINICFWALLYKVLSLRMSLVDAMLLSVTGRGLTDAQLQIWIANACENGVTFILVILISAMILQRVLGK